MKMDFNYSEKKMKNTLIDSNTTSIEDDKKYEKVLLICGVDDTFVSLMKEKMITLFDNKLMIPSLVKIVNEIPKLGSGKKDFRLANVLALK